MPLNTLRLNHQPSTHPNERIVFIKPIPRPAAQKEDYDRAELVLKAIAAQCLPIMKEHYLSVTTLEEYEPNPEFIGRNFNNGEIIQLVLKSKSGTWLPLSMIQMVMMHELAHNTHMNHSKYFWETRNLYSGEMRELWKKGYTGDGLWGSGYSLQAAESAIGGNISRSEELSDLPLCGGTFRSRRKKRKLKNENGQELSWKEKKERRIEKKFGKNGAALGEDEDKRINLQLKNKIKGGLGTKPRVAQSKRGRELRAAAALARFDTNKKEISQLKSSKSPTNVGSDTESEYEEVDLDEDQKDATDGDGQKLLDSKGKSMIRVCEEESEDDEHTRNEMAELSSLQDQDGGQRDASAKVLKEASPASYSCNSSEKNARDSAFRKRKSPVSGSEDVTTLVEQPDTKKRKREREEVFQQSQESKGSSSPLTEEALKTLDAENAMKGESARISSFHSMQSTIVLDDVICNVCTSRNPAFHATCQVCANVTDPKKDSRWWHCPNEKCRENNVEYKNAGDCGLCGLCGARRNLHGKNVRFRDNVSLIAQSTDFSDTNSAGSRPNLSSFTSGSGHIAHL